MIAVDTSVVVAGFASWHEYHDRARTVLNDEDAQIVGHCLFESYSVLTRLPAPHRAPPDVVSDYLSEQFREPPLTLDANGQQVLVSELVRLGISGGAVYDALIARTAGVASATLVSCDRRAIATYDLCGVATQVL